MISDLSGKTIVIVGCGSGLGRSLASLCLSRGSKVIGIDLNSESLTSLKNDVQNFSGSLIYFQMDMTNRPQTRSFLTDLSSSKTHIDYWFNVAAINNIKSFIDETGEEVFEQVLDVNFRAPAVITRHVIRHMIAQGNGTVVNIGSILAHIPASFMVPYCSAKAAMLAFTRSLSLELDALKIPVKLLSSNPGYMKTPILKPNGDVGFPDWLLWLVSDPNDAAKEVLQMAIAGIPESYPTRNGRFILRLFRIAPIFTLKLLFRANAASSFREFIFGIKHP